MALTDIRIIDTDEGLPGHGAAELLFPAAGLRQLLVRDDDAAKLYHLSDE